MTGLLLLAVVVVWVVVVSWLTHLVTRRIATLRWRPIVGVVVFTTLLVAPLLDEIIGGFQFRALCAKNANFQLGVDNPAGRITRYFGNPVNEIVPGTAITIYHTHIKYIDTQSGETVLQFDEYVAKGGAFIRALGISEGNAPITIGHPSCSPEQARNEVANRTLKFSVIN